MVCSSNYEGMWVINRLYLECCPAQAPIMEKQRRNQIGNDIESRLIEGLPYAPIKPCGLSNETCNLLFFTADVGLGASSLEPCTISYLWALNPESRKYLVSYLMPDVVHLPEFRF